MSDLIAADERVGLIRDQIRAVETVMRLMGYEGEFPVYPVRRATFPIFARGEISREVQALRREAQASPGRATSPRRSWSAKVGIAGTWRCGGA